VEGGAHGGRRRGTVAHCREKEAGRDEAKKRFSRVGGGGGYRLVRDSSGGKQHSQGGQEFKTEEGSLLYRSEEATLLGWKPQGLW